MAAPTEQAEFYSFNVQYMGTAIIPQSSTGLKTLQKPLKDLYCSYQRPSGPVRLGENLLTITDMGVIVSRLMVGEVGDYATGAEVMYEMSSIQFWDAIRFVVVKEKEKKYRYAFEPLNNDQSRNKDNLFSVLDLKHDKYLSNIAEHPILFVITILRKSGLKVVDLHAFICSSDDQAITMTQHVNVNKRFMKEDSRQSSTSKKSIFGKKKRISSSPVVVSMSSGVYVNQLPNPQKGVDSGYTSNTNKSTKKKKWGFSKKSNLNRSVSVPDLIDAEISMAVPRHHDLTKGDFIHTRVSNDARGSHSPHNYLEESKQVTIDLSNSIVNSSHLLHSSAAELRPHGSSEHHFYENGKPATFILDRPEKSGRLEEKPSHSEVLENHALLPKPLLLQNDQFINIRGLGGGKTYRVYENTPRDNKQIENIVGEKFRRFGEEREANRTIALNQKYERNFERGRGKEPQIKPVEQLNISTERNFDHGRSKEIKVTPAEQLTVSTERYFERGRKETKITPIKQMNASVERNLGYERGKDTKIIRTEQFSSSSSNLRAHSVENSPRYENRESRGDSFRGRQGPLHSSMTQINTDTTPLSLINGKQTPPATHLKLGVNQSPSYRRKFPTPKASDKMLLPSPKLPINKTVDPINSSRNASSNIGKPLPQIKKSNSFSMRIQSSSNVQETPRLKNKEENDVQAKKKKPVPTPRKTVVENRFSPNVQQTVNAKSIILPDTPRGGAANKPIAFVQPRKVQGVRVLPLEVEDIAKSERIRDTKPFNAHHHSYTISEQRARQAVNMNTSGSDFKEQRIASNAGNQRFGGTFYTRTNLESSLGYLP